MSDAVIKMKRKCAAFIVMHHLIKKKIEKTVKKNRRYWIKHLYQDKSQLDGIKLMDLLSLDESTGHFKNFLRMSANDFEFLINKIGPKIAKMDTKLRKGLIFFSLRLQHLCLCLSQFPPKHHFFVFD